MNKPLKFALLTVLSLHFVGCGPEIHIEVVESEDGIHQDTVSYYLKTEHDSESKILHGRQVQFGKVSDWRIVKVYEDGELSTTLFFPTLNSVADTVKLLKAASDSSGSGINHYDSLFFYAKADTSSGVVRHGPFRRISQDMGGSCGEAGTNYQGLYIENKKEGRWVSEKIICGKVYGRVLNNYRNGLLDSLQVTFETFEQEHIVKRELFDMGKQKPYAVDEFANLIDSADAQNDIGKIKNAANLYNSAIKNASTYQDFRRVYASLAQMSIYLGQLSKAKDFCQAARICYQEGGPIRRDKWVSDFMEDLRIRQKMREQSTCLPEDIKYGMPYQELTVRFGRVEFLDSASLKSMRGHVNMPCKLNGKFKTLAFYNNMLICYSDLYSYDNKGALENDHNLKKFGNMAMSTCEPSTLITLQPESLLGYNDVVVLRYWLMWGDDSVSPDELPMSYRKKVAGIIVSLAMLSKM